MASVKGGLLVSVGHLSAGKRLFYGSQVVFLALKRPSVREEGKQIRKRKGHAVRRVNASLKSFMESGMTMDV